MANKIINIKAEIPEAYVDSFLSMLKRMEYNGNIGKGEILAHTSYGGWDMRPKFEFDMEYKKTIPLEIKEKNYTPIYLFDSENEK